MTDALGSAADLGVDAVAALTRQTLQPRILTPGNIYAIPLADGTVDHYDLTGDGFREYPRRKTGTVTVTDPASFLAYWEKHSYAESEVYADRDRGTITGILDAHAASGARWQHHRLVLRLEHTASFQAWSNISGRMMTQVQFAEFLEDHRPDIRTPTAAELLELATTFHATTRVAFTSSTVLQSGQRQLEYTETTDASAGAKRKLAIPNVLDLGLLVYKGGDAADQVSARFRYRIESGRLQLGVILDRLDEVVDTAFEAVVKEIDDALAVPVLRGVPA